MTFGIGIMKYYYGPPSYDDKNCGYFKLQFKSDLELNNGEYWRLCVVFDLDDLEDDYRHKIFQDYISTINYRTDKHGNHHTPSLTFNDLKLNIHYNIDCLTREDVIELYNRCEGFERHEIVINPNITIFRFCMDTEEEIRNTYSRIEKYTIQRYPIYDKWNNKMDKKYVGSIKVSKENLILVKLMI